MTPEYLAHKEVKPAPRCMYKRAQELDLDPLQVLKTVYFESKKGRLYGAVVPSTAMVDTDSLVKVVLDDLSAAERKYQKYLKQGLRIARELPQGMYRGCASPFPLSAERQWGRPTKGSIARIVYDSSILFDETADFAVGSPDKSIVMPFYEAVGIVRGQFPGLMISGTIARYK